MTDDSKKTEQTKETYKKILKMYHGELEAMNKMLQHDMQGVMKNFQEKLEITSKKFESSEMAELEKEMDNL